MFSDFVNFKDVDLIIDNKPSTENYKLVSVDITHDNEIYQVSLESLMEKMGNCELINHLKMQISQQKSVFLQIKYELKKTKSQIIDLYNVLPDKNKSLMIPTNKDKNIFTLNCHLMQRTNIGFDYESGMAVNF